MSRAVMVTGATGFFGSHLVATLLERKVADRVVCVCRPKAGAAARQRVAHAIDQALHDQGLAGAPDTWYTRLIVVEEDLTSTQPVARRGKLTAAIGGCRVEEFWHCAASTSFSPARSDEVWQTNVGGLRAALQIAADLGVGNFNHISTAYVAGCGEGRIMEEIDPRPRGFNNLYEESKHFGEKLVIQFCPTAGMRYRIFRPSILIGHSRTYRTSSAAGFYNFLRLLWRFHQGVVAQAPDYFCHHTIKIRAGSEATLDLIPVDIALAEILELRTRGTSTLDRIFHVTSDSPISAFDFFDTVLSAVGFQTFEFVEGDSDLVGVDRVVNRTLRLYSPYYANGKIFDRSHLVSLGIDHDGWAYVLDAGRLALFSRHYLESLGQAQAQAGRPGHACAPVPNGVPAAVVGSELR
jgi:nucleoside-diphosphate-sugar epimerase